MFKFLKKFMSSSPTPVEQQILRTLQAGHTLTVRWDCGGDESFVYTEIDGVEQEADYDDKMDFAMLMDRYLTELLKLPDAGEFSMQGTGRIFQAGSEVVIEYQSRAEDYGDDDSWQDELTDEQLADLGISPHASAADTAEPSASPTEAESKESDSSHNYDPDMSADYSGRKVLFTLVQQ